MTPSLRRLWMSVHRWLGLSLGTVLVLASLLGSLLTVAKPLDHWLHPELFADPLQDGTVATSLAPIRGRLDREFGPDASYTFRPARQPGDALWVFVRGPWEGKVFFDAAGRELGRRGEHEGFFNLLFELHSALLLGDWGKAALTWAAGAYMILLASGLALWWPRRWPPSFRVHWSASGMRISQELHHVLGALLGVLIAVSVASGAYMAWPPLRALITTAAAGQPVAPPRAAPAPTMAPRATLDDIVATARRTFPGAMVGYVHVPAKGAQPVRVRLKAGDDPHPNGLSSVWLHPVTGEVLKQVRWDALDPGNRLVSTVYPLHTGALGGPLHTIWVGLSGLLLSVLGGAGLWLWWQRRTVRRRVTNPAAARARPL